MDSSRPSIAKASIAAMLIVMLAAPLAQAAPQQELQGQQQPVPAMPQPSQQQTQDANQQNANPQSANAESAPQAPAPQLADPATRPNSLQQQNSNPVGTAAAPVAKPTGVAASRPAGAVIAPAKQRRVRAIVIRVGIIVGAGVAIGTVAGLSRGSSARP
jgi:hypothetical protein